MDSARQNSEITFSVQRVRRRYDRLLKAIRIFGASLALATAATACVATVEPEYAVATDVPADITVYPHTYYDGRVVYYVNDRWYYRGPEDRWVYYREVPAPLYERRATMVRQRPYVQAAPPAHHVVVQPRRHEHHERYDDDRRVAPELRQPVPATQVR